MTATSKTTKIQRSITVVEFLLSEKQERIDRISKKTVHTEDERIFIGQEADLIRNVKPLIEAVKKGFSDALGMCPPYAYDLEECVIGALILEGESFKQISSFLEAEHFYSPAHQIIFRIVKGLVDAGSPLEMRTVIAALRTSGELEIVGGAYYLAEVTSKVSQTANIQYHARILIEMAIKRRLILIASKAFNDARNDTTDCFEILEELDQEISKIKSWIKQ